MTPTITAFERSPDRGRGLARDMRVRWARIASVYGWANFPVGLAKRTGSTVRSAPVTC